MIGSGLNRLRRIATPQGWQVERAWHPAVLAELGADMHAEVAAQRLAAAHGLAPSVLEFDAQARVMRMPWVEGAGLEADWPLIPARRAAMADLLARLRAVSAPGLPTLDLPGRVRLLHDRLAARDATRASVLEVEVRSALAAWDAARPSVAPGRAEPGPSACLVHGDLTPGNVRVRHDGSLLLLDWEYAFAGGPWDDLAALAAWTDGCGIALPEAWDAAPPPAERPRFEAQRRLRRTLDALWHALRAALPAQG